MIAVMGPEAAVNAVHANRLEALPEAERAVEVARLRAEYAGEIDLRRLAAELVIDAIVMPESLREELVARFAAAAGRRDRLPRKRHAVTPV
jgi:acetyl-CoA carboxylase carboxyltransferase component